MSNESILITKYLKFFEKKRLEITELGKSLAEGKLKSTEDYQKAATLMLELINYTFQRNFNRSIGTYTFRYPKNVEANPFKKNTIDFASLQKANMLTLDVKGVKNFNIRSRCFFNFNKCMFQDTELLHKTHFWGLFAGKQLTKAELSASIDDSGLYVKMIIRPTTLEKLITNPEIGKVVLNRLIRKINSWHTNAKEIYLLMCKTEDCISHLNQYIEKEENE